MIYGENNGRLLTPYSSTWIGYYSLELAFDTNRSYILNYIYKNRSKKVSSKFGVYEFWMSSEFKLVIACLLFLSMTTVNSVWLQVSICIVQNRRIEVVT